MHELGRQDVYALPPISESKYYPDFDRPLIPLIYGGTEMLPLHLNVK